jgi:phytanoyl-CoA hydroxylase
MKTGLSDEQVFRYREDGFLKIEKFLNTDELNNWRARIDNAVNTRDERIPGFNDGGHLGDDYYDNVFKQRVNLWQTSDAVRGLVLNENIGRMAAALEDVPAVRLWHDQALYKGPWANPTSWHIDDPYWSFYSRNATTIWIALDDTTMQNGALYFLPGAYKQATYDNVLIGKNVGALFDVYKDWTHCQPTCVEMKAGDASFHNGLTPHAAGPNMTPSHRRAFAIIFMPDGSTFNGQRNVLPGSVFNKLNVDDPLDDGEFNPIIYQRGGIKH